MKTDRKDTLNPLNQPAHDPTRTMDVQPIDDIKCDEDPGHDNYARNLIEAIRDPLFTISADGNITDINLATQKITELSREELIGTNFIKYFTHPENAKEGY